MLSKVIDHIRNRSYMSGVDREKSRVKATGEVFTPTPLVQEILDQLPAEVFTDPTKTFLDPTCGDGQFLGEVLIRKMENGSTFEQALSTVYGVDLMIDNVDLCRERLLCGREDLRHIVEKNIVCYNGLEYDFEFSRRKNIEVKHENKVRKDAERARKKAEKELEAARKKAEKEKLKIEKLKTEARKVIWNLMVLKTGKAPTETIIERELRKRFPDVKGKTAH
jgi:type I restriction-modification system DNA methylase subunit